MNTLSPCPDMTAVELDTGNTGLFFILKDSTQFGNIITLPKSVTLSSEVRVMIGRFQLVLLDTAKERPSTHPEQYHGFFCCQQVFFHHVSFHLSILIDFLYLGKYNTYSTSILMTHVKSNNDVSFSTYYTSLKEVSHV